MKERLSGIWRPLGRWGSRCRPSLGDPEIAVEGDRTSPRVGSSALGARREATASSCVRWKPWGEPAERGGDIFATLAWRSAHL